MKLLKPTTELFSGITLLILFLLFGDYIAEIPLVNFVLLVFWPLSAIGLIWGGIKGMRSTE